MTITRELQSATIKAYGQGVDDYGQLSLSATTRTADIAFKVYAQQNVQDPRYVDVELIGLTKDRSIVPGEVVSVSRWQTNSLADNASDNLVTDNSYDLLLDVKDDYRVKYVIPSGRWQQLMLVKL